MLDSGCLQLPVGPTDSDLPQTSSLTKANKDTSTKTTTLVIAASAAGIFFVLLVVAAFLLYRQGPLKPSSYLEKLTRPRRSRPRHAYFLSPARKTQTQISLLPNMDDMRWEVPFENITFGDELGKGAFGRVVKAEVSCLPNSTSLGAPVTVAIKTSRGWLTTNWFSCRFKISELVAIVTEPFAFYVTGDLTCGILMHVCVCVAYDCPVNATKSEKVELLGEIDVMRKAMYGLPEKNTMNNIVHMLGCVTLSSESICLIMEYVPHGRLLDLLRGARFHVRDC